MREQGSGAYKGKLINIIILTFLGVLINLAGNGLSVCFGLPVYLDAIGTILVAALAGYLPGIAAGFLTNLIESFSDTNLLYYGSANMLTAVICAFFASKGYFKKLYKALLIVPAIVFTSGILASAIAWLLESLKDLEELPSAGEGIFPAGMSTGFGAYLCTDLLREFIDKGIAVLLVCIIIRLLPDHITKGFSYSPYDRIFPDRDSYPSKTRDIRHSIRTRIVSIILFGIITAVIVSAWISYRLYRNSSINDHIRMADGLTDMIAYTIDPKKVDEYLEYGEAAEDYASVESELYRIRDSYPDVQFLYVYRILEDGCHVVYDLDTRDIKGMEPGAVLEFDDSFAAYREDLLSGRQIEPIISDETFGYLLTVYKPILDEAGNCACYACVDFSMNVIREFGMHFVQRLLTIMSGFFIFILLITFMVIDGSVIAPIVAITSTTEQFSYDTDKECRENVRRISALNINTGDEIEDLHRAFVKNAEDILDHVQKHQEQMKIISAIADIYYSFYELDIEGNKLLEIKTRGMSINDVMGDTKEDIQIIINRIMTHSTYKPHLEHSLKFVDISTMDERFKDTKVLTMELANNKKQWRRGRLIALERNEEGKVTKVLWVGENIDDEVKARERLKEYMENLQQAEMLVEDMKEQVETLDGIAYTDALTGLKNKASYDRDTESFGKAISSGDGMTPEFAIVMIDLNHLKKVNDTYGHEHGNAYLMNCAEMISRIYGEESSYRFGGDEFVVVLSGDKARKSEAFTAMFKTEMEELKSDPNLEPWEKVSAAVGISHYKPGEDKSVEEVFKRADGEMYKNKLEMKAVRKD